MYRLSPGEKRRRWEKLQKSRMAELLHSAHPKNIFDGEELEGEEITKGEKR